MLPDKQTNSNPAKQSSTFMGTLQDKLKDIKNFSNWSAKEQMVAVTAVGVIFGALLPVVAVALPVAATGAAVALTLFFAVKAVEYGYKGLKWSAEKTWEGAKYTAGKIKAGAVYAKDQLKSGTSHTVRNVSQSLDRLSSQTNYSEAMLNSQLISSDAKNKIVSIKEQFMNIFDNEKIANKDRLLEKILENIVLQIESKKDLAQGTDSMKHAGEWNKQINFINGLDAEKLHNLLMKQSSPKNTYFLYTIFSEHHSEIKEIIEERKTEHKLSNVVGKYGRRVSSTQSTPPSLSRSSSTDSLNSASSTVGLLTGEHKEVKTTSSLKSKVSSFFRGNKAPKKAQETTGVKYQVLSEPGAMPSAGIGNSIFYVAPQKPPRSNSPSPVTDSTVIPNDRSSRNKVIIGEYSEEEEKKQLASSTATVDPTRLRRNSLPSSLYDGPPVLNPVTPPKAPESPTSSRDSGINSDSSTPPKLFKPPVPPKPLAVNLAEANKRKKQQTPSTSRSDFSDSGINSDSSTPTGRQSPAHMMLTEKDGSMKKQAHLKKTGRLDELVGQPSTEIDVDTDVQHQTAPNFVA